MNLNNHSRLRGRHALFSPSQPAFFSMTPDEFRDSLARKMRASLGTEIHGWAFSKISRRHKVTSVREAAKSIDEYIFNKYYNEQYDSISVDGRRLLKSLNLLPPEVFETAKSYVNDAIGFRMKPEVVVEAIPGAERFFGTIDAVIFSDKILRIHDLKTGSSTPKIDQLLGYDVYYCMEYDIDPYEIEHELRIYWNNDVLIATPTGDDIKPLMEKIHLFDQIQADFEGV